MTRMSVFGRLFQARMWRRYAMAWDGMDIFGDGMDRAWVEGILRVSRSECLRRARINVKLAHRLNNRPAKVAESIAKQIASIKCSEPEETIKNTLGEAIDTALAAFPPGVAAKVEASGSQYVPDSRKLDEKQNTFSVSVQAIYGFVE